MLERYTPVESYYKLIKKVEGPGVRPPTRFLSSILPYTNADWEKVSIFLTFLVPKLPAPGEEDLSRGILEAIDMDSYQVEKQAAVRIQLPDAEAYRNERQHSDKQNARIEHDNALMRVTLRTSLCMSAAPR